jgi:hypothetical protein
MQRRAGDDPASCERPKAYPAQAKSLQRMLALEGHRAIGQEADEITGRWT